MSFTHLPIQLPPASPEEDIIADVKMIIQFLKSLFEPPKQETPQDVEERNRQMREFCDYVNAQAKQTEDAVVAQLNQYNTYLLHISEQQFAKYKINTTYYSRQIELLSMQIPSTIASEVSRQLTDSNAEFSRIRRMLPGAEKEAAMQKLARHAIQDGCDKCATLAQQIFDQIQEGLFADLQEKMTESRGQLNRKSEELAALQATAGDVQKQAELRMSAELVFSCSTMVIDLFKGSK